LAPTEPLKVRKRYIKRTPQNLELLEKVTVAKQQLETAKASAQAEIQVQAAAKLKALEESVDAVAKDEPEEDAVMIEVNEKKGPAAEEVFRQTKAQVAQLEAELTAVEQKEKAEFQQKNGNLDDRSLEELYGDIVGSSYMIYSQPGKVRERKSFIETVQRQLEAGDGPSGAATKLQAKEYEGINAYFLYSQRRQCPFMLHRVSTKPSTWEIKYQYKPCPFSTFLEKVNSVPTVSIQSATDVKTSLDGYMDE